jgi:alpha-galactosidase
MKNFTGKQSLVAVVAAFLIIVTSTVNTRAQNTFIPIETKNNALVLHVTDDSHLNMVYFGKKLSDKNEYQHIPQFAHFDEANMYSSAYTTAGTRNLLEPAIAVTHADGNRSLDLKYVDQTINKISDDVSLVTIRLKDPIYNTEVSLF